MLSQTQVSQFVSDGFLIIRSAVPPALITDYRVRVRREYRQKLITAAPTETRSGGIIPVEWEEHARLYWEALQQYAAALLGPVLNWFGHAVVLEPQANTNFPLGKLHIDRPNTTDRNRQWPTFSLNIGVAVEGGGSPSTGGLGVFPKSHSLYQRYFRAHPALTLWDSLTNEYHPVTKRPVIELPAVDMPPLSEVLLNPGDAVLMHSLLAHTSMPNRCRDVRIAAYYRIIHPAHAAQGNEFLRSIWSYWEPEVRSAAGAEG